MKNTILIINDRTDKNELWTFKLSESHPELKILCFTHPNSLKDGPMLDMNPEEILCILFDKVFAGVDLTKSESFKTIKRYFKGVPHLISSGLIEEGSVTPGFTGSIGPRPMSLTKLLGKMRDLIEGFEG